MQKQESQQPPKEAVSSKNEQPPKEAVSSKNEKTPKEESFTNTRADDIKRMKERAFRETTTRNMFMSLLSDMNKCFPQEKDQVRQLAMWATQRMTIEEAHSLVELFTHSLHF
jgi:hypothetical protein